MINGKTITIKILQTCSIALSLFALVSFANALVQADVEKGRQLGIQGGIQLMLATLVAPKLIKDIEEM